LLGGGIASLQALTISVGLPFCVVLLVMCVGLVKGLFAELSQVKCDSPGS
jgi:BCCT family betaine/carnitine transporter